MRVFQAHAKQPVYTIIEIGVPKTKADNKQINEALEAAGSGVRIAFEKAGGTRVYAIGHPYIHGGGQFPDPVFGNFLVVAPNGSVAQTDTIDGFVYKAH